MKFLQHFNLKGLLQQYQAEGLSMRRRLAIYLMSALIMIMSLVLLLFNFFGILNPADHQIKEVVTGQLSSYAGSVERDYDKIAAYAISFAEQIEEKLQNHLSENGIAFGDLKDDADAINDYIAGDEIDVIGQQTGGGTGDDPQHLAVTVQAQHPLVGAVCNVDQAIRVHKDAAGDGQIKLLIALVNVFHHVQGFKRIVQDDNAAVARIQHIDLALCVVHIQVGGLLEGANAHLPAVPGCLNGKAGLGRNGTVKLVIAVICHCAHAAKEQADEHQQRGQLLLFHRFTP